ncbi:MAG: YcaO-like family protein, partial [Thermodesulfobacteriota bacterium]
IEAVYPDFLSLKNVLSESDKAKPALPSPAETADIALDRLAGIGVIAGEEMRHTASLSPIALLREWRVDIRVEAGLHRYRLTGKQTSYGRGLELEQARAAYAMEMVERCSAFASIGPEGVIGYQVPYPLIHGRFSEFKDRNIPALNPNHLALQAPYEDEPLYWLEGATPGRVGSEPILVPVQCVFLFSNLDEIALFSGLGSTGLASGNTMAQAKVNALLEIIERHCEGVTPFAPDRCFDLETTDPRLATLLLNYLENGIRVQFQDLTSPLGIPCCKCFVMDAAGDIIRGTGAHLNAGRALISAMTETPYPFPGGPPSSSGLTGLLRVPFEKLPDFTTGSPETDLALLEQLLVANGYRPLYVDLTRRDLSLPVVRALIPGMEITADFDRFSRVHPRLFANYIRMFR